MRFKVNWRHGTYAGTVTVLADDEEHACGKAKARLRREGALCLPMAYESFKAVPDPEEPGG